MSLIRSIGAMIISTLLCSSCVNDHHKFARQLNSINEMINVRADSALILLREIDPQDITRKADKAKLALLHSIALDKNRIDLKTDSILSPAIRYYARKGSIEDQVKTLYYSARIYENSRDYENALRTLVNAERHADEEDCDDILSLIYAAKGRIYQQIMDYTEAADNYSKSAGYSYKICDIERYVSSSLREAHCLLMSGKPDRARNLLSKIQLLISDLSPQTTNRYFQFLISINETTDPDAALSDLEIYLKTVAEYNLTDWLLAARIYIKTGHTDKAFDCLSKYSKNKDASYYYLLAQAYESSNDHINAVKAYKEFIRLYGQVGNNIMGQDTRFVEEREMHQEMYEKEKSRRIILSLAIAVALLGLSLTSVCIANIRKQLKIENLQKENLQNQLDELMLEREELAALEARNQEGRKIISERLRIIDQFVMSDAFHDIIFEAKASETLRSIIDDRSGFVRQNRLIFNQSAPKFISHLTESGLTDMSFSTFCTINSPTL